MSVQSFGDFDDLFEQMRRDQAAADRLVQPWQTAIKPDDYVWRPGPGFYIYSQILTDPEPRAKGLEYYRFTRSYSIACENGELGDIHVSTIEGKLSQEEFELAGSKKWDHKPINTSSHSVDQLRADRLSEINAVTGSRQDLENRYEQVWNSEELAQDFDVVGFLAPYVAVTRKADGIKGSLEFQHNPRFYFNFETNK